VKILKRRRLILFVCLLAAFITLTFLVVGGYSPAFDEAVIKGIYEVRDSNSLLTKLFLAITTLASPTFMIAECMILMAVSFALMMLKVHTAR